MERSTAILTVLAVYLLAMLGIGMLARARTHGAAGFYLGGRTLGPWVTALAANSSSSSAWSLVGTSGFAYQHGLAALWLLPGCVGGFLLNWLVVAPRLRAHTGTAVTLTELLAGPPDRPGRRLFVVVATALTLAALLTYVAAQMQAAGAAFAHAFEHSLVLGIALGAVLTVAYTLLGGYLAASLTDTVQGLVMVAVAVLLPCAAVAAVGGPDALATRMAAVAQPGFLALTGQHGGAAAFGFAIGLCGIGLGYPGQPHAMNKYMGMAPGANMTVARTVGIGWAVVLYTGMIALGWAARVQWDLPAGRHEDALYVASQQLFSPVVDGVVLAAVLAAIMSTVDSQLLVCASCVTHDLSLARRHGAATPHRLGQARATVLAIGTAATAAALVVPSNVFDNVMFAWAALGSSFGPLLLVTLLCAPVPARWATATLLVGGLGAILGFYFPLLAKGFPDRVLAWLAALAVAFVGARRGRADHSP